MCTSPQTHTLEKVSLAQFLDACGSMIIFDPIDSQQLSQDSLILLSDNLQTAPSTLKGLCEDFYYFLTLGKRKNCKIPQNYTL